MYRASVQVASPVVSLTSGFGTLCSKKNRVIFKLWYCRCKRHNITAKLKASQSGTILHTFYYFTLLYILFTTLYTYSM